MVPGAQGNGHDSWAAMSWHDGQNEDAGGQNTETEEEEGGAARSGAKQACSVISAN
jgi:hypothetical protein